jgi:hypothetical protein
MMPEMKPLYFRQIHLDYHTSPLIPGVGDGFDPQTFADTLARAAVNSVTVFARCHHGMIYYDTELNPERHFPNLKSDLLPEQIEALHARGIRAPIYTTVQWDDYTATHHPDWLVLDKNGDVLDSARGRAGFYRYMSVRSPYKEFLKEHVREIFSKMPVDGLFFDIVQVVDDWSEWALREMREMNLDPHNPQEKEYYNQWSMDAFKLEMTEFVRQFSQDCTIFYNAGHIGPFDRTAADAYSHYEIESLPSGGWGYLHFPVAVRFARTLGKDVLGMTGKFHTSWGDFHSFKNQAALEYECFRMLALNAKCSVGDQLHPSGVIDPATYDLIGAVYRQVEAKEPWCADAKPLVEVGLFTTEAYNHERVPLDTAGATMMLQEASVQFDVIDAHSNFADYKVLVLPDTVTVDEPLAGRLAEYLSQGGAVIASYKSGLKPSGDGFALAEWGASYEDDAPYSPDFLMPRGAVGAGLAETEHVMYQRGLKVTAGQGAEVLAEVAVPYFNRTPEHFCSHRHTPSAGEVGYPGILRAGNVIYFAHPLFSEYGQSAPRWSKTLFLNALNLLLPERLLTVKGPSTLQVSLNEQPEHNRLVAHLLHYIPERRGRDFDTIEDVIPISGVEVTVKVAGTVKSVALAPQGESIPFETQDGRVTFTVPEVLGHQMVEIALG